MKTKNILSGLSILLLATLLLSGLPTQLAQAATGDQYEVKGAGTTAVNGVYTQQADSSWGGAMYTYDNAGTIYYLCEADYDMGWAITDNESNCEYRDGYYVNSSDSSTPPETGWNQYFGDSPAPTVVPYVPGANIEKSVTTGGDFRLLVPGDPVTYTIEYENTDAGTITGVVLTDTLSTSLTNLNVDSSGATITPRGGTNYVWDVADLGPGQGGIITITGEISPTAPEGTIVNTAEIAASLGGGSSSVSFGLSWWRPVGAEGFESGFGQNNSLALDSRGVPFIAYQDTDNNYYSTVKYYNTANRAWETLGQAGFMETYVNGIDLAFDSSDVPYVVIKSSKLTVMRYINGAWEAVGSTEFTGSDARNPSLVLDSNDVPYVAYLDYGAGYGNRKIVVMRYTGGGTTGWETVGNAGSISSPDTDYPSLALDSNDVPYVAYWENIANGRKATVIRYTGGSWQVVGTKGFSTGIAYSLGIALDSSNVPYVAYADGGNDSKATVMRYNSNSSTWETVGGTVSTGSASGLSLALDSSDVPYVSYSDGSNEYKTTVMRYTGSAWEIVGIAGFPAAGGGSYLSLALDSNNVPYVAYKDYGNANKATVMRHLAGESGPQLTLTKAVSPSTVKPGEAITYTISFNNTGVITATQVVITDTLSAHITNPNYTNSGVALTPVGGAHYAWTTPDLLQNDGGVITITGILTKPLAAGTIPNTVTLAVSGTVKTANADLTVQNVAPVANAGTDQNKAVNSTVTLNGSGTDDNGDTLTYGWAQTGGSPTVTLSNPAAQSPTFTAPSAATVLTFTLTVTDTGSLTDTGLVTITVTAANVAPSFTKGADQTVNEDAGAQTVTGWATEISSGPANELGQTMTFTVSTNNPGLFSTQPALTASQNPSLLSVQPGVAASDGTLTYTPAANANGSATITVTLKDDGGTANGGVDTSPSQTFMITVTAVNDAPSFTKGADQTVNEDAGAQTVTGWATGISSGPTDEVGQTMTFTVSTDNPDLFSAQPALTASQIPKLLSVQPGAAPSGGTLTYTPAPNVNGSATITVTLKDGGGTAHGGVDTSPSQTFMITVTAVNDAPSFIKGADQTVNEDIGAQIVTGWATGISSGPTDEAGQTMTFTVSTDSPGLFSAQPAVSASHGPGLLQPALVPSGGTLTYTPAADANGSATITVTLKDDGGTAYGGVDTSPSQTFMITVTAVNDAPVAVNDTKSTDEDTPVTVHVLGNDSDVDKDTLTVSAVGQGSKGSVSTSGANVTYTPTPNFNGSDTFTYTVSDGSLTDTGLVTITVNAVNDAPTASAGGPYTVNEGGSVQLNGSGYDVDGDTLSYQWDLDGDGVIFEVGGPTPSFDASSLDGPTTVNVTLKVSDGKGGSGSAATWVTVNNVAPTLSDLAATTMDEGGSSTLTGRITEPGSSDALTLTVDWGDGSPSQNFAYAPGTTLFTQTHTYADDQVRRAVGQFSIDLALSDDDGGSSTASTSVTVNNVAPTADAGGPYTVDEGSSVQLNGSGSDVAGDPLTYAWDLDGNGSFETPGQTPSFSAATLDGPATITVTLQVSDDGGGSMTDMAMVTVNNVAPTADAGGPYTVVGGGSVQLSGSGSDVPADPLTFAWDLDGNGSFETPGQTPTFSAAAITGPVTITVTVQVSDDDGSSTVDTALVTVTANDTDLDGVDSSIEDGVPTPGGGNGDGNGDGTPDRDQSNISSFPNATDGGYLTLVADAGITLADVQATQPQTVTLPAGVSLPQGLVSFHVANLTPGGTLSVTLIIQAGALPNSYWKYGPTPANPTDHWYEFSWDGQTGAQINGNRVILAFVDGQRGDRDLLVNGTITDPGAPAFTTSRKLWLPFISSTPGSNQLPFTKTEGTTDGK